MKVVIGISGGVDSATAALLLINKGYEVHGLYLMVKNDDKERFSAEKIANKLGIPLTVKDVIDDFNQEVIDYFIDRYNKGMTPSPCVVCNKKIKFKYLIEEADRIGAEHIATGHYAKIVTLNDKKRIGVSNNREKDQSYMLANLTDEQVQRLILPLEEYTDKGKIREIAKEIDEDIAFKKDSQELCFINDDVHHSIFLKEKGVNICKGEYIDKDGNILGENEGYQCYTIGQRKGLNIALGQRIYVTKIDEKKNQVTLGENEELFTKTVTSKHNKVIVNQGIVEAKIRFSNKSATAKIISYDENEDILKIEFDKPVRAVTPGQFLVLYKDDIVVGIGEITDDINA